MRDIVAQLDKKLAPLGKAICPVCEGESETCPACNGEVIVRLVPERGRSALTD